LKTENQLKVASDRRRPWKHHWSCDWSMASSS